MKNKKIFFILLFVLIILSIILFAIIKKYNNKVSNDMQLSNYTPQEEISPEQLRQTSISLFFLDDTYSLKEEKRLIDAKKLVSNPYKELILLLIEGPISSNLSGIFPENTKLLDAYIQKNQVTVDFSSEILNFKEDSQKLNIINSMLKTLKQLDEVKSIKILINNIDSEIFDETYVIS